MRIVAEFSGFLMSHQIQPVYCCSVLGPTCKLGMRVVLQYPGVVGSRWGWQGFLRRPHWSACHCRWYASSPSALLWYFMHVTLIPLCSGNVTTLMPGVRAGALKVYKKSLFIADTYNRCIREVSTDSPHENWQFAGRCEVSYTPGVNTAKTAADDPNVCPLSTMELR